MRPQNVFGLRFAIDVAMVAATGWSHTQNTSWERGWVHPDMEGDAARYDEWRNNRLDRWQHFSYQDMEEHGQLLDRPGRRDVGGRGQSRVQRFSGQLVLQPEHGEHGFTAA